jgi:DNA modification methylase
MPYYEQDGITIYHGDCREILGAQLRVAGALISDPPYGLAGEFDPIQRPGRYGRSGQRVAGDGGVDLVEWLEDFIAIGKLPAILFGMWQRSPTLPARRQIVWDKGQFGLSGTNLPWINSHEIAWVFGDGWFGIKRGTVWRAPRNRDAQHPTEKPLDLLLWLVACARPEWEIVDPCCGSGTTLVAAKNLQHRAIGIEIEERYCEMAARRLDQGVLDLGA